MKYRNKNKFVTVFNQSLAKKLLKEGHIIIDLRSNKHNKDKTVFVFLNESGLDRKVKRYFEDRI